MAGRPIALLDAKVPLVAIAAGRTHPTSVCNRRVHPRSDAPPPRLFAATYWLGMVGRITFGRGVGARSLRGGPTLHRSIFKATAHDAIATLQTMTAIAAGEG